ncbi:MAG: LysR family transcriptional regulator [Deltaproteobacteria bacterium]|nr:LysR family transcriptional regulator [Deltaproteobacteria bacterium]
MQWLNYHHLLYFWHVARSGSVSTAAKNLRLSQPTVSAQLKLLEQQLGVELFIRRHRRLELTDAGRIALRHADEIFGLGRALLTALREPARDQTVDLRVGLTFVVPKLIAHRLLGPAVTHSPPVRLHLHEDRLPSLLARLPTHELDLVVSDAPVGVETSVRAYNHPLGESGVTWFASEALARQHRADFPHGLDGAPMLLPMAGSLLRRDLELWFERRAVRPRVVAEFDDSALLKVFGQSGRGIFTGPTVIEREIRRQYGVQILGRSPELRERFYAITLERRVVHPAVQAVCSAARERLFE